MYIIDDTEASLIIDDFTKYQSIQITKVAGSTENLFVQTFEFGKQEYLFSSFKELGLQFAFDDGRFFLRLKGLINKGDKIYFLLENEKVIEKTVTFPINLHRKEFAESIELSVEEIKMFAKVFLAKWKITRMIASTFIIGGFVDNRYLKQYPTSEEGQYLFLLTARQLIKQIIYHLPSLDFNHLLDEFKN